MHTYKIVEYNLCVLREKLPKLDFLWRVLFDVNIVSMFAKIGKCFWEQNTIESGFKIERKKSSLKLGIWLWVQDIYKKYLAKNILKRTRLFWYAISSLEDWLTHWEMFSQTASSMSQTFIKCIKHLSSLSYL